MAGRATRPRSPESPVLAWQARRHFGL